MSEATDAWADRQLPSGDEIFLDHVAHFVADPALAAEALARAGFAPTPVSIQTGADGSQPTGTGNVTAMLRRGYIEALFKTADTPLGREFDAALSRYHGLHLIAFGTADAAGAHRRASAQGFRMRPLVEMQRPVDAGGHRGTAAFTVVRLEPGEMPEGRIQVLTHRTEDMVWQPRWLTHPNGALGLAGVLIAVGDVDEAAARFGRFTGREAQRSQRGRSIALDRGHIELVSEDACRRMLPEVVIPALPLIAAYQIVVGSLDAMEKQLSRSGLAGRRLGAHRSRRFPTRSDAAPGCSPRRRTCREERLRLVGAQVRCQGLRLRTSHLPLLARQAAPCSHDELPLRS